MKLIINADDFGMSKSITDGIIECIKAGYISSTTLMSNMPQAEYAIKEAVKNNIKCVGLHINLTVGVPIIPNNNLTDRNGSFLKNRQQIERNDLIYEDVYNEIIAQINKVEEVSKGKLHIDHIDTHHYLLENTVIRKAVMDIAKRFSLPIRKWKEMDKGVVSTDVLHESFTIVNVNINNLIEVIKKHEGKDVIVEIVTHPGYVDDYTKSITSYIERDKEIEVLKQFKEIVKRYNIEIINFSQINYN